MEINHYRILGVRIDAVTMQQTMDWVREKIINNILHQYIVVVNVAKLVKAKEDSDIQKIIDEADLVTADGMPIVWYSKLKDGVLPERVSGIDIMTEMFKEGAKEHWGVYLLGAKQPIIEKVVSRVNHDYKGLTVAGFRNGYFSISDEKEIVDQINSSHANILLLGFSSPQKEEFVDRWKEKLKVNIIHGVGGSFDVYAGITKRAPLWMQHVGLEWLYRLLQEPTRMFGRYAVTNVKFCNYIIKDLLGL